MSEYLEYGGLEEATKDLRVKVSDFFQTDFNVLYDALREAYEQGREDAALDIENAVIEVAGNSAHTMQQAARIARTRG